jgi:hypothetical protein
MEHSNFCRINEVLKSKDSISRLCVAFMTLILLNAAHPVGAESTNASVAVPAGTALTNGQDVQSQVETTVSPFTLTACTKRNVVEGQPAVVTLTVHNNGTDTYIYGYSAFERSAFSIVVTDSTGKKIPRTALGNRVLTEPSAVFANASLEIKSGETRLYRFNLARMFDLSHPGEYSVNISRTLGTWVYHDVQVVSPLSTPPKEYKAAPWTSVALALAPLHFAMVEDAGSTSGSTALTTPQGHQNFLYMLSQKSTSISCYRVHSDESFSPVSDPANPSAPQLGKQACSIVATLDGRFIYVCNNGDDTVSQFRIGDDGNLVPLSPATVPTGKSPERLLMDPKGRFLYATANGGTMCYAIGPDGRLTQYPLPMDGLAGVIDPSRKSMVSNNGILFSYRLSADGSATTFPPTEFENGHATLWRDNAIAISPSGKFAYIGVSTKDADNGFDLLVPMRIEADGTLTHLHGDQTPQAPPHPPGYCAPLCNSLTIDPSGQHLIVVNDGCLDSYKIGKDGSLTSLGLTPFKGSIESVFFVPGGHIVYTINSNPIALMAFRFDFPYGGMTPVNVDLPDDVPYAPTVVAGIAPTPEHWGLTTGGIAISARLSDDVYPATKPLVMTVRLKNTSTHPIRLGNSGEEMSSFSLSLTGPKRDTPGMIVYPGDKPDTSVPLLAAGRDLLDSSKKGGDPVILPPGGERQYQFVLSRLADFSVAGQYTVQVNRSLPGKVTASSQPVSILLEGPWDGIVWGPSERTLSIE